MPRPVPPLVVEGRADRAAAHLISLQRRDGCWEGEMVWNAMIVSQYVILKAIVASGSVPDACVPSDHVLHEGTRAGILRHLTLSQRADGSWGMHPESNGYVFFTALSYIALRLLGVPAGDPRAIAARRWLRAHGGVIAIPTWGKCWLAFIGLYRWEGINPCPPELFLLPRWLPVHPRNYYCHTRCIYLALACLAGRRFSVQLPLTDELRRELYDQPFDEIDFVSHRHDVCETDLHVRPSRALRLAWDAMARYERSPNAALRQRALDHCLSRILDEQGLSKHQSISPVSGILDCLAIYASGDRQGHPHPMLAPAIAGVEAWRWEDESDGVRYAGARSNTWDTAFALQALVAAPRFESALDPSVMTAADAAEHASVCEGYRYLRDGQRNTEHALPAAADRDPALGGWCFSDGQHGWPVSDCTAEAVCALLAVHRRGESLVGAEKRIDPRRLAQAASFILARQNSDGGFGSYERRRGGGLLDALNPTEMFGACMTERSYVECTASSLAALAELSREAPAAFSPPLARRTEEAITSAIRFLRRAQREDGTWPAFWGIHSTWAIFHAVKGLRAAGIPEGDAALVRAAEWLVTHQKSDGGWGEHYTSCLEDRYVEHPVSQVVATSHALLTLIDTIGPRADSVPRGIAFLRTRQQADGSWPIESPNGVFFGSAMLDYRLYRIYFPTWALRRYEGLTGL